MLIRKVDSTDYSLFADCAGIQLDRGSNLELILVVGRDHELLFFFINLQLLLH